MWPHEPGRAASETPQSCTATSVGVLEEEIRNSHGVASFAYEAAHVFLCYP